jgi:hypothetical protein
MIVTNRAEALMSIPDWDPDEIVFQLSLTRAQLKVTHTALRSLLDDFGHNERDVGGVIREVLDKLPSDSDMRALDLSTELRRRASRAA